MKASSSLKGKVLKKQKEISKSNIEEPVKMRLSIKNL